MASDRRKYLPLDKSDVINTRALLALGYPALAPYLRELLEWLQDGNWPIPRPIGKFLLTNPQAVAPFVQEVLEGDDHPWKYWCIVRLISEMTPAVAEQYRIELFRLTVRPTLAEAQNELNEVAKDALQKLWPCEYHFRSTPLLNNHEADG